MSFGAALDVLSDGLDLLPRRAREAVTLIAAVAVIVASVYAPGFYQRTINTVVQHRTAVVMKQVDRLTPTTPHP